MGRIKFNIDGGVDAEANTGGASYSGPLPPKGPYRVRLKRMELVINSKDNPMFRILLEIAENKGSKLAKYNGYGIWDNINVTDQGKGYVNGFLDALAGSSAAAQKKMRRAFWETGIVTEGKDDLGHVLKIGTYKIDSPNGELIMAAITKLGHYKGEEKLEVASYALKNNDDEDDDEEDEEDEDDLEEEDDEEEEDEDEEDGDDEDDDPDDDDSDDEDDDGDDEEDDDEEEEEEEEEEPVKPVKKRTTAAKRGRDAF